MPDKFNRTLNMKLHTIKSKQKQFSRYKMFFMKNFHLYNRNVSDKDKQYIGYVSYGISRNHPNDYFLFSCSSNWLA